MAEGNGRRFLCQLVIGLTEHSSRDPMAMDGDASFFVDILSSGDSASSSESACQSNRSQVTRGTYLSGATMMRTWPG